MLKKHFLIITLILSLNLFSFAAINTTNFQEKEANLQRQLELGVKEYTDANYEDAIKIWKLALKEAEDMGSKKYQISLSTNIGACYNAIGYHKTALNYFFKTEKLLEQKNEIIEHYWINQINIGVCYMSLEQFDMARKYFDSTDDFNEHIIFLKNLNLAKWHGEQGDQKSFYEYKVIVDKMIVNNQMYLGPWYEMQLDYLLLWEDLPRLKALLDDLKTDYDNETVDLKIVFNDAWFLVYKQLYEPIEKILSYGEEALQDNNLYVKRSLYSVLKAYYYQQNDLVKYAKYAQLSDFNIQALYQEKNMLYVEDFKAAQLLEQLQNKFLGEQLKNKLINSELAKKNLLFNLSIFLIAMGLVVIFLLIKNRAKSKTIFSLEQIESQNKLLKKELEKVEIAENLKLKEIELQSSLINLKKIMLLKSQLEKIATNDGTEADHQIVKQIKLVLNSFFENYRELSSLINKKMNVEMLISKVRECYPLINSRELQVLEHIHLQFTTKEIAILMDKSEKSIEYNRVSLRKKLELDTSESLEQFLERLV